MKTTMRFAGPAYLLAIAAMGLILCGCPADSQGPATRTSEQPADQPADQPEDQPADQPADPPGEQPADQPADQPEEGPGDQPGDQPGKAAGGDFGDLSGELAPTVDEPPATKSTGQPAPGTGDDRAGSAAGGDEPGTEDAGAADPRTADPGSEAPGTESTEEPASATAGQPMPPGPEEPDLDLGPPLVDQPEGLKRLDPNKPLWINAEKKQVIMQGYVCQTEAPLEMFACLVDTKEHESIVAADVEAFKVHAGLLAVGADAGHPVRWDPSYVPAAGEKIEVLVRWNDKDGKVQQARAQDWIRNVKTEKAMEQDWVFAGSGFWEDPTTGEKLYQAEGGDFICVSNFSTAMLDLPIESSQANAALLFEAFTERIPPRGTPVTVILRPLGDDKGADDKAADAEPADGPPADDKPSAPAEGEGGDQPESSAEEADTAEPSAEAEADGGTSPEAAAEAEREARPEGAAEGGDQPATSPEAEELPQPEPPTKESTSPKAPAK